MAGSITDHVIKLQELTQKNLDILQALNDSFFTDQNHLSVTVGDNQYAIPSFITLENKLNVLAANFDNLVHAPETGEAYFNFDGNSRSIEVRSYNTTPESLVLNPVQNFEIEQNDIFKDFLTPNPYIHLDVQSLPNDTTQVLVKKIIPTNSNLVKIFESQLSENVNGEVQSKKSVQYPYKDLYKILSLYTQDVDYIEYDTKVDLPIRKSIGSGTYAIEEILEDRIDDTLTNYLTIKLRKDLNPTRYMSSLKYRLFDETIERALSVGDQLVTFEGNAKLEITELRPNTNTIVVKVLHGDFVNLMPSYSNEEQYLVGLNKLRFCAPIDFAEDKYVRVPLEEDKFIYIAVAGFNSRMNVQSPWGTGLMVDAHELLRNDGKEKFKSYYDDNVRNVGDVLFEIASMMSNTLTKYSHEEFNEFTAYVPELDVRTLAVTQINNHLNDSAVVQNIRALYSQKKDLQNQLSEIQADISALTDTLSTISFDDTTGRRAAYSSQITSLNSRKNEINISISKILDEIAISANNSEVPIENAKYRIRGYFDTANVPYADHIRGLNVQYRYRNVNSTNTNSVLTVGDSFTFSDWNEMTNSDRIFAPYYDASKQKYVARYNDNIDGPKFNQIDIPISQGEIVDIRVKVNYDFGAPFIQTSTDWSRVVSIAFPEEYLKDVKILDIITENNNDIESNRFSNIIKEEGIPTHISDKIVDQDITYFHKPENIASGFYTPERRIIPLKDKLEELVNTVTQLRDEVYGASMDALTVSIVNGSTKTTLNPYIDNRIFPEAYNTLVNSVTIPESGSISTPDGYYDMERMPKVSGDKTAMLIRTVMTLSLANNTGHAIKLFSMFPGDMSTSINDLVASRTKFQKTDYCAGTEGVYMTYPDPSSSASRLSKLQGCNQFLYFRINDINTGEKYYDAGDQKETNILSYEEDYMSCPVKENTKTNVMWVYPSLRDQYSLCLDTNTIGSYLTINPKDEILIPIVVEYNVISDGRQKTLSFDILPSLYKDPINYKFTIVTKAQSTIQDRITNNVQGTLQLKNGVEYNPIVK